VRAVVASVAPREAALAAVVFEGPLGTDGLLVTADMGPAVPFGRGGHCPIRFGHGPAHDSRLAREAGALVVAGDRLAVESSSAPGHLPVQVALTGRPPVELSQGELYAPASRTFDVVVRGEREWTITVRTATRARPAHLTHDEPPTDRPVLPLSGHERSLLDSYVAPLREGRYEPATHAEVAQQLGYSVSKVRFDLYDLWARMVSRGLPVPGYADKRMAVARAALANGIV
jgi:hypothetical protein